LEKRYHGSEDSASETPEASPRQLLEEATSKQSGLDDEQVDASRINPMGEVREEMA
jgi:hypothetical protein